MSLNQPMNGYFKSLHMGNPHGMMWTTLSYMAAELFHIQSRKMIPQSVKYGKMGMAWIYPGEYKIQFDKSNKKLQTFTSKNIHFK